MTEVRRGGHCDLCHKRLEIGEVIYTYFTPCVAETAEESAATGKFWAEDPRWAACEGCKKRIDALDEARISLDHWVYVQTQRALRNQAMVIVGDDREAKALHDAQLHHIVDVLTGFAINKIPEYQEEINAGIDY